METQEKFSDILNMTKWKRRLDSTEVGKLVRIAMAKLLNVSIPGLDTSVINNYPRLEELVKTKLNNTKTYDLRGSVGDKSFSSLDELIKVNGWTQVAKNILDARKNTHKLDLFEPIKNPKKADIEKGEVVPIIDENEIYESTSDGIIEDIINRVKASDVDVTQPSLVQEPGEPTKNSRNSKNSKTNKGTN